MLLLQILIQFHFNARYGAVGADNPSHVGALVLHSVGVEGMLDFPQAAPGLWGKSQFLGIQKFSGVSGVLGGLRWSGERQGVLEGANAHARLLP